MSVLSLFREPEEHPRASVADHRELRQIVILPIRFDSCVRVRCGIAAITVKGSRADQ